MLDNETKMWAHHKRSIRNEAIPVLNQAVNNDPKLFIEAQVQITAAVYTMCQMTVPFVTMLGNISYFTHGQEKGKADRASGRRKLMHKQ